MRQQVNVSLSVGACAGSLHAKRRWLPASAPGRHQSYFLPFFPLPFFLFSATILRTRNALNEHCSFVAAAYSLFCKSSHRFLS